MDQFFDPSRGRLGLNRRVFLLGAGISAGSAMASWPVAASAATPSAAELVAGKDPRLIVHTARPCVFETPVELLATDNVTPVELLFVRNNQQPSTAFTIKPLELANWKIELSGLVDRRIEFDARLLGSLPQVEHEMVLQCSGNSRSLFARSVATKGSPWGRGGMGNVRFGGVPLSALLDHQGLKIDPQAQFLTAEGIDEPAVGEQDFEHSLPLDEALKKSVLALRMNGEPLPAIHGGPVRLVTLGYYGTMHIKWLSRLRFTARESDQTSQIPNYRTPRLPINPGDPFTATYQNSEPNWRMKTKCVVLAPAAGSRLSPGATLVRGVAFNDGEARIETVLISSDSGRTWRAAELEHPKSAFAWSRWQCRVDLPTGRQQVWARAIDALGRGQPADGSVHWNPQGYTWNGMEKIELIVG